MRAAPIVAAVLFAASAPAAEFATPMGPEPANLDAVMSQLRADPHDVELLVSYGTSKGASAGHIALAVAGEIPDDDIVYSANFYADRTPEHAQDFHTADLILRIPKKEYLYKTSSSLGPKASFGLDFGEVYKRSVIGVRVHGMAQVVGALNLAAGLRDAWLAHSPVIAFTGGRDPKSKFRKVYQEVDDVPSFEPVTKWNATVDAVERIPDMVRQAFRVAVSGGPGPVHLQFRGNEGQLDLEELDFDGIVEAQFARVPPFRPGPDAASLRAGLALLQAAKQPVIVAGGGVRASDAARELVALAEKLQIPVATSLNAKDAIAADHPLSVGVVGTYSRESANRVVAQADLVFFVGTEAGGMARYALLSAPGQRVSTRVDFGEPVSTRKAAVRLSRPHVAFTGAQKPSTRRLYELMVGQNIGANSKR